MWFAQIKKGNKNEKERKKRQLVGYKSVGYNMAHSTEAWERECEKEEAVHHSGVQIMRRLFMCVVRALIESAFLCFYISLSLSFIYLFIYFLPFLLLPLSSHSMRAMPPMLYAFLLITLVSRSHLLIHATTTTTTLLAANQIKIVICLFLARQRFALSLCYARRFFFCSASMLYEDDEWRSRELCDAMHSKCYVFLYRCAIFLYFFRRQFRVLVCVCVCVWHCHPPSCLRQQRDLSAMYNLCVCLFGAGLWCC